MFVILLQYVKPLEEVDRYLQAHRNFLDKHYATGTLLCSGGQKPRIGGVILARGSDMADITAIFKEDPFWLNGIANYEIREFEPTKYAEIFTPCLG